MLGSRIPRANRSATTTRNTRVRCNTNTPLMTAPTRLTLPVLLHSVSKMPPEVRARQEVVDLSVAMMVIKYHLGEEWLERHASPFGTLDGYFRVKKKIVDGEEQLDPFSLSRLSILAECLFNLQHVPGFDTCVSRIRSGQAKRRDSVEGPYAELQAGQNLYMNGWDFRFMDQIGVKRSDYDFEITLQDGLVLCADAKCKIETTPLSAETVTYAINKAQSQLPEGRPGIAIIKMPEPWMSMGYNALRPVLREGAIAKLRNTTRLVGVSFYAVRHQWDNGLIEETYHFYHIHNPNNAFDSKRDWDLFHERRRVPPTTNILPRWISLRAFPHEALTPSVGD